jgi:hypothetical protein
MQLYLSFIDPGKKKLLILVLRGEKAALGEHFSLELDAGN